MYSVGEEFEMTIEDDLEFMTCVANLNIKDKEYIICENENGIKRVFLHDVVEDELEYLEDEEADEIIAIWEDEYFGTDKEYMYWNDESGNYDNEKETESLDALDYVDDYVDEDDFAGITSLDDDDLDDFLNDFLDD